MNDVAINTINTYQFGELATPAICRDEPYLVPEEVHAHDRLDRCVAIAAVCQSEYFKPMLDIEVPSATRAVCRRLGRVEHRAR